MAKKYYYRNKDGELAWHDQPLPEFGKENVKKADRRLGTNVWSTGFGQRRSWSTPRTKSKSFGKTHRNKDLQEFRLRTAVIVFFTHAVNARYLKHRGLFDRNGGYGD